MWGLLIASMFILSLLAIFYIAKKIQKLTIFNKIQNEKLKYIVSIASVVVIVGILWYIWGYMNAMICVLHLIVFWMLSEAIFHFVQKKKQFKRYWAGIVAIVFTVGYLFMGWQSAHYVVQTDYVVKTNKDVEELRIALISDSHVGATFHGDKFYEHLKTIEKQNPDMLVIAGDFVDDDTSKEDMIKSCEALGKVRFKYGIYYVFGNHDKGYYDESYRGYNGDDLVEQLEKNNVVVLQDENVLIDNQYYLIGRNDRSEVQRGGTRKEMSELVNGLDQDKFSIVLDHQPNDYQNQSDANVDLVLSGHTHGGQLFPLMNIENLTGLGGDNQVYGYKKEKNTNFIVSSGIADWNIKFKTGCISEYVIVDIKK